MMDAVGEPYALEVNLHRLEVGRLLVALITCIDRLQGLADAEVVLAVLVEQDVTALQSRFRQIIDQLLLLERKLLEARHTIA